MALDGFERFERPVPAWFKKAKFGIFIHWGAYSVPAWAEPKGELGVVPDDIWFAHNPYAEWYFNTIRIEGSPAAIRHKELHGNAPYDDFLDQWQTDKFDPRSWAELFKKAGAQYVIPTTKHHDGITLWDAPGTGTRNTVARGPKRDLIADISNAVREVGIKFGVYYSGGLDWSVSTLPPITVKEHVKGIRPRDAAYAMYCHQHLVDLIDRYKPDILWNDIEYPDFGKHQGEYSLASVFDHFYSNVQEGLVNDRWCVSHSDYTTSEYQHRLEMESGEAWENCRGIGFSFGYNQVENESHYQSVESAIRHLVNIVSRGGNLLLNIGPTASGEIPDFQRVVLEGIGAWLSVNGGAIYGSEVYNGAPSSETPWIRWTQNENDVFAIIDQAGQFSFEAPSVNELSASVFGGEMLSVTREGTLISMNISASVTKGPIVVSFKK